jgi:FkbM family methyltransferase
MMQIIYRLIYNRQLNFILRNINKLLLPLIPGKIKLPPSGILCLKNQEGKRLKIATNQTNYLTYLVFWEGGYRNFEYTDIFIKLIRKVKTFYDIGANIGYYSLIGSMENPELTVAGFEPATGPSHYFRKNIEINGFRNIRAEDVALSQQEGEIEFYEIRNKKYRYLEHNLGGEGNTGSKTTGRNFVLNKVRTTTLDNYVTTHNDGPIDLIKMDTEGTENLILERSAYVLKEMKPIIICETLFNTIEPELERIMLSFGYEFYNHTQGGLKKVPSIVRKTDDGVSNCFFVHPEKYHLIAEFVKV